MQKNEVIKKLKRLGKPANIAGMARFGINPKGTLGVPMPALRSLAKSLGHDHKLALALWQSGFHEARILAGLIDELDQVTPRQMDLWAKDFDSWDVCDQVCMNLFDKTPWAYDRAKFWARQKTEFVRRAGFALMAALAVHDKTAWDSKFEQFFPLIKKCATDGRNFVKKAVNWALRQIGKRNRRLCPKAIKVAREIYKIDSKSARWIAADAIRELRGKRF
jgi:3-methyladenine DNA glycosylase AlkD